MKTCLSLTLAIIATASVSAAPPKLTIGVAQTVLESSLTANRDKIAAFMRAAKARGCRVVVFPETALYGPDATPQAEIDQAADSLRQVAKECQLYALFGGHYKRSESEQPYERLLVIGPDGQIVQTYNKMWHDARFNECPGIFEIDGIPCAAALCADRWIRSVEDLPAVAGAKILFECSNNYANEWLPDLGHYWYVPRAIRNEAFVVFSNTAKEDRGQLSPGHGHSAIIDPAGHILTSASEESDTLLVAEIDLTKATLGRAQARRRHPALAPFWETGVAMLAGQRPAVPSFQPLVSPRVEIKLAAAQMACSRSIADNVAQMISMIRAAAAERADLVVFPELALTGARADDIAAATQADLEAAVAQLAQSAKASGIYVAFGLPWHDGDRLANCALVLGPSGEQLTRYKQLVVDRDSFAPGHSTHAMWFRLKGVPAIVTIGGDALWSELSEMAAWRGAQVHLHLDYSNDAEANDAEANDSTRDAAQRRRQLWANVASFRTFTATVNAASPASLSNPSAKASGGSILWDDYHRAASGKAGGYFPHSAVEVARASTEPTILYATQKTPATNVIFRNLTDKTNRPMAAWYIAGATAIDAPGDNQPPPSAATTGPYFNGKFRGRIAYSADGNHNDPDDWAASPVALAILAETGLKDRLVHFHYNCILPKTDPEWEKIHATSVLGAAKLYGYDPEIFFDCRQDLERAIASLARQIDASTADDPLYFIVAGPMEVPCRAIERSRPDKRQFVYCISHSRWNDGYSAKYEFTNTKRSVIETGVHWVQIRDQNRLLSLSPYGQPGPPESFASFQWLRDAGGEKLRFLWDRLLVSTRPDPSDAGMAYFLATGDEDADPAKLKALLADHAVPKPLAARSQIRLEAENFRQLEGYEIDDRNDRNVSHRLSLKPQSGKESALLRTEFNEPYAALRARYDVELRYLGDQQHACRVALTVAANRPGAAAALEPAGGGWQSHVFKDIEIAAGDEITLKITGPPPKLDYIELRAR